MQPKNSFVLSAPPDQGQRITALDPHSSILVQAPAGSGKTDLLTRRFLRLLAEVDDPGQIVAITFTRAAAAEMRHRILAELEKASARDVAELEADEFSMEALAARALGRSRLLDWRLPELASRLRISTIDSFCRDLAIQQPIYSGIGNNLQISERPTDLYRRAARATMQMIGDRADPVLSDAIIGLLLWRDNGWRDLEDLLVKMLGQRDRWMHAFVLSQEPDWIVIRERLERPLSNTVRAALDRLTALLLNHVPEAGDEAIELARFACAHGATNLHRELAELANFPYGPHRDSAALEDARNTYFCLANLLLTGEDRFRRQINKLLGFPKEHAEEKQRMEDLIEQLSAVPGLEEALAEVRQLPPARYTEDEWQIVRASFILLRHAAGELKAIFAETGTVDFIEVAQIARHVLLAEDQFPSDAALVVADDIRHLLVDEFQDTSRRQHEFITSLIKAWEDRSGRTIFVVGDPMQSIYFFRDAEAELFRRAKERGFEFSEEEAFPLHPIQLTSNFRADPELVSSVNDAFEKVFAAPDGSGIQFAKSEPARNPSAGPKERFELHLDFIPRPKPANSGDPDSVRDQQDVANKREAVRKTQINQIVTLIHSHLDQMEFARSVGQKYRVAVLGRARTALAPIASALREAGIPFRAVELENLKDRPEILDAASLTRAFFSSEDRVAWLSVLRAPWCGLSLAELHAIAGTDDASRPPAPIQVLLRDRLDQLSLESRKASQRVLAAFASVPHLRNRLPVASIGTVLQQLWLSLGGDRSVDATGRANLDLFWKLLDELPGGEKDLSGPTLDAALEDLFALPDPATSSECGVQLMTIHKSKGLEFEVVIVPDLHARTNSSKPELLSWLERGVSDPDESGDLTEFLVAPLQFKGAERGKARRWVDRTRHDRELQETRRILYVAATRAREELHLFAQPAYKIEDDGSRSLQEPRNCLLDTAWPAFGDEIRARFGEWNAVRQAVAVDKEYVVDTIAATGQSNLVFMRAPTRATSLRRLPPDFQTSSDTHPNLNVLENVVGLGDASPYQRHAGGQISRSLGNAVHKLLEELARLRTTLDWDSALAALEKLRPRITASMRSAGVSLAAAERVTAEAFDCALSSTRDANGQWILSPHSEAFSESGWGGIVSGNLRLVRVDRLFRAGLEPRQSGNHALWIIDYKTAHTENIDPSSALPEFRATFEPQLQMYAAVLRNLHGPDLQLRAGLYYPRMSLFDWWEIQ
ncbi:MAG: UvrD-helicase domain-containing protein [Terracidiphilus sp.]